MGSYSKARGAPVGPPVTRFHSVEEDMVDVEAGLPLAEATVGEGRITASELAGGQVVSTYHFGPYDKLNLVGGSSQSLGSQ